MSAQLPNTCPSCGRNTITRTGSGECYFGCAVDDLEDILERAFWHFDAVHKAHYRDVAPELPGPMSERDAFKSAVRHVVLDALGKHAVSA